MKRLIMILALILGSWSMDADAKVRTGQSDAPVAVVDVDHGGDSPGYRGAQIAGGIPGVLNFQTGQTSLYPFVGRGDSPSLPRTYIPVVIYGDFSGAASGGGSDSPNQGVHINNPRDFDSPAQGVSVLNPTDSVLVWLSASEILRWAQTFGYNDTGKLSTAEQEQFADSIGRAVHRHSTDTASSGGSSVGSPQNGGATETTVQKILDTSSILSGQLADSLGQVIGFDPDFSSFRRANIARINGAISGGVIRDAITCMTGGYDAANGNYDYLPIVAVGAGFGEISTVIPFRLAAQDVGLMLNAHRSDAFVDSVLVIPKGASSKLVNGTDTLTPAFQIFRPSASGARTVKVWSDTDIYFYVLNSASDSIGGTLLNAEATGAEIAASVSLTMTTNDTVAIRTRNVGVSGAIKARVTFSQW